MTEERKRKSVEISRREFLKDAGLLVGGTAIGSTVLLAACGGGETITETVTQTQTTTATATQTQTATVTTTQQGATVTETQTQSRFICPIDGMEFDTLTELQAHFAAEHPAEVIEIPAVLPKLTINGRIYEMKLEPNWTLQYVLHDKLGLTAAKMMCGGKGQCGSCTVIMDGRPILSCMALAAECVGHSIETVEEIAAAKHPIIESFIEFDGMQCGFCIPGAVATAKALLDRNPNPTSEEVAQALSGNLCICGTYPAWTKATLDAAQKS